jgi:hypothetical protein
LIRKSLNLPKRKLDLKVLKNSEIHKFQEMTQQDSESLKKLEALMMAQWDCDELDIKQQNEEEDSDDVSGLSDCPTQEDDELLFDSESETSQEPIKPKKGTGKLSRPEVIVFNEPQRTTVHTSLGKRQFLVR